MTMHDPSATRPGRVILASVLCGLSLVTAALAGWGWTTTGVFSQPSELGIHVLAILVGQGGAIVLLVATAFALPSRWRGRGRGGPLMTAQAGLMFLAASVGIALALPGGPGEGRLAGPGVAAGLGVVLIAASALRYRQSVRRAEDREQMIDTGRRTVGLVTEVAQTGTVNGVPRWRVVTRFTDTAGATRWITKHITTWHPPSASQPAAVFFNPARPADQRHIVVSW